MEGIAGVLPFDSKVAAIIVFLFIHHVVVFTLAVPCALYVVYVPAQVLQKCIKVPYNT